MNSKMGKYYELTNIYYSVLICEIVGTLEGSKIENV